MVVRAALGGTFECPPEAGTVMSQLPIGRAAWETSAPASARSALLQSLQGETRREERQAVLDWRRNSAPASGTIAIPFLSLDDPDRVDGLAGCCRRRSVNFPYLALGCDAKRFGCQVIPFFVCQSRVRNPDFLDPAWGSVPEADCETTR